VPAAVKIAILANASNAVQAFKDTGAAGASMSSKLEKVSGAAQRAFAPAVGVLGGLGAGLFTAGQAASELGDSIDASKIILGDAQQAVEKFAGSAGKNFGISKQSAIDAANSFGNIGSKAGLAGKDLEKFTTDMLGRAGDAASMFGGTSTEAVEAFGSALRGEFEPIRRYGVLLDDASLKASAMKLGLIATTKQALTPQQKALAAQAAILEQTAKAAGNFADTAGSAKNQQEALKAELANTSAELGKQLLPAMSKAATILSDVLTWVKENDTAFKAMVISVGALAAAVVVVNAGIKVFAAVEAVVKGIKLLTGANWALNASFLANPITWVIIGIVALIAIIVLIATKTTWFQDLWHGAMKGMSAAVGWIKDAAATAFNWVKTNWPLILAILAGPIGLAVLLVVKHWDKIKETFNRGVIAIVGFFTGLPGKLLEIGRNLMAGLGDGIQAGIQWVKDKVQGLGALIPGWLKSVLGIRSPSKVMAGLGGNIVAGLADGITSAVPTLRKTLGAVNDAIQGGLGNPSVNVSAAAHRVPVQFDPASTSAGNTYNIALTYPVGTDLAEAGRQVVKAIHAHERLTGRHFLAATPT